MFVVSFCILSNGIGGILFFCLLLRSSSFFLSDDWISRKRKKGSAERLLFSIAILPFFPSPDFRFTPFFCFRFLFVFTTDSPQVYKEFQAPKMAFLQQNLKMMYLTV